MTDSPNVTSDLDWIARKAATSQWPGRTGARDFRILATIIRRIGVNGSRSLKISTDLPSLAFDAGLAYCDSIRDALDCLADGGRITWKVGRSSINPEERRPSTISLIPVDSDSPGRFGWRDLPDPTLSPLYESSLSGNHGYLIVSAVKADGRDTYSTAEVAKLTGLNVRSVRRAMPELVLGFCKVDGGWQVDDLDSLSEHGAYGASDQSERTAHLTARRDRGRVEKAEKPDHTEAEPETVEPVAEISETNDAPDGVDMAALKSRIVDYSAPCEPERVESETVEQTMTAEELKHMAALKSRIVDYSAPCEPERARLAPWDERLTPEERREREMELSS